MEEKDGFLHRDLRSASTPEHVLEIPVSPSHLQPTYECHMGDVFMCQPRQCSYSPTSQESYWLIAPHMTREDNSLSLIPSTMALSALPFGVQDGMVTVSRLRGQKSNIKLAGVCQVWGGSKIHFYLWQEEAGKLGCI